MISRYWKAIAALVLGGLGWAQVVVQSDSAPITKEEWTQAIAVLIATAGVFFVPNTAKEG